MQQPKTVADELPKQIERVTELLVEYEKIKHGEFAARCCRSALARATKALADGDIVEILRAYKELEGME